VYASALSNAIKEIKKSCPEVTNTFVFQNLDLIANDDSTSRNAITQAMEAFYSIKNETKPIGNLKLLRIEGAKGKINLTCLEKFELATVISNQADENYVNTLTRVLVPTVIKLVDEIKTNQPKQEIEIKDNPKIVDKSSKEVEVKKEIESKVEKKDIPIVKFVEPPPKEQVKIEEPLINVIEEDKFTENVEEEPKNTFEETAFLAEPPVTQLIVEELGGLFVPSDTVRIDKEIIDKWNEIYEGNEIKMLLVESINGKSTQCKYRKIKSSKHTGKGIIRIPEKIQSILETSKGELVTIKPIIG
jgi:hypothetical protein